MKTMFQIKLKSVLVIENGRIEKDVKGNNSIGVNLYYPREGVPSISSIRQLKLKDKVSLDYTQEDYKKQLLFKEIVNGTSILEVEISAIEKVSKFEKLVVKLLGVAAKTAIGAISGVGAVITAVATSASESLFEMAAPEDKISIIGRGSMPLNENTPEGDFVVQLSVPKEISLEQHKFNDRGEEVFVKKTLPKDFVNAQVVFQIEKISIT